MFRKLRTLIFKGKVKNIECVKMTIDDWHEFYKKVFGENYDFSNTPIPKAPEDFSWLVCIAGALTPEQAFSGGKKQFKMWRCFEDCSFDEILDASFGRDALRENYILRMRPNLEADDDLDKNRLVDYYYSSRGRDIETMSLRERLLLGRFLYWKYKIILDKHSFTDCSRSSRYVRGERYQGYAIQVSHSLNGGPKELTVGRFAYGEDVRPRRVIL